MEQAMPFLLVGIGLFSILGGVMNWEWYMNNRRAQGIIKLFGRSGARIFYVLLGLALAGVGGAQATGVIDLASR